METEKDLNAKVLKLTMFIKDEYPELSKFIEEMPVTIPNQQNPEITLTALQAYHDSLNALLNNYILQHLENKK